jgi:hypothetical protein
MRAKEQGKTAARVAAEVVLRDVSMSYPALEHPLNDPGDTPMLHHCIVHERDVRGMIARQHQIISLVDITRVRGGKVDVLDVFLDGEWLEIEGRLDEFVVLWEQAKAAR